MERPLKIEYMWEVDTMDTITIRAHFDGERILLDEPFELEPNAPLIVTVLPKNQLDAEHEGWLRLSKKGLEAACGEDEVEYSMDLIKS